MVAKNLSPMNETTFSQWLTIKWLFQNFWSCWLWRRQFFVSSTLILCSHLIEQFKMSKPRDSKELIFSTTLETSLVILHWDLLHIHDISLCEHIYHASSSLHTKCDESTCCFLPPLNKFRLLVLIAWSLETWLVSTIWSPKTLFILAELLKILVDLQQNLYPIEIIWFSELWDGFT